MRKLTEKQREFARQYTVDFNAKRAAIRAGYSPKSAQVQGCKLLTNPKVVDFLKGLQAERNHKTEVTAARVIEEMARIAFTDHSELFEVRDGKPVLKTPDKWTPEIGAVVKSFRVGKSGVHVQLHNKSQALEQLAKHLGIYTDPESVVEPNVQINIQNVGGPNPADGIIIVDGPGGNPTQSE